MAAVLDQQNLKLAFKKQAWNALRKQPCSDLLGLYDYNLDIDSHCERIRRNVEGGSYQRQQPLQIEVTKSDLLVRRKQLPHPDEAIIMTAIANRLEPLVKLLQPSRRSYYGRSDVQQKGIHLLDQTNVYPWFYLWKKYQKQLLEFSKARRFVVVSDIQNFFDSIDISRLRIALNRITQDDELSNFILYLFENYAVRHKYSVLRGVGIPTIESDLPRLVAHCLLFDVDEFLERSTRHCFSRWVDDFNFGVSNRSEARDKIRAVERLLYAQGLRLGGGKTRVMDRDEVSEYIQEAENQYLNVILADNQLVDGDSLVARFVEYRKNGLNGYTEKVVRRYYNGFAHANEFEMNLSGQSVKVLVDCAKSDFQDHPDTRFRRSVVSFLLSLPYTKARVRFLLRVAVDESRHDDELTFAVLQGLTERALPPRAILTIVESLVELDVRRAGGFFGMCWILAKYGTARDILEFVSRTYAFWSSHEMCTRQIVVLWSLLPPGNEKQSVRSLLRAGNGSTMDSMESFIARMRSLNNLTDSLRGFLPPNLSSEKFELYRALVSRFVLESPQLEPNARKTLIAGIRNHTKDRRMNAIASGAHTY